MQLKAIFSFVFLPSHHNHNEIVAFQDGAYLMDQEFDGKGLTPYDPAHNSTYLLAGETFDMLMQLILF